MAKKDKDVIATLDKLATARLAHNPLMSSLRENDKRHLFDTTAKSFFHKTGFPLFDYYFGSVINVHDAEGKIDRQEPRVGQAAGTFNMIVGNTGTGKALPNSALIPTPLGLREMGELEVGDCVFDRHGLPTTVLGVYPQGEKRVWTVTTASGKQARCSPDHLWTYMYRCSGEAIKTTATTEDMGRLLLERSKKIPKIPRAKAVNFLPQATEIPPYLFGRAAINENECLALFSIIDDRQPCSQDARNLKPRQFRELQHVFEILRESYPADPSGPTTAWPFWLAKLKTLDHIRLPNNYLFNDIAARWQLLRGLIDGGGMVKRSDDKYQRFVSVTWRSLNIQLLIDIANLSRSLGLEAKLTIRTGGSVGRLRIKGGLGQELIDAFPLETRIVETIKDLNITNAESAAYQGHNPDADWEAIVDVRPTKYTEEMTCIKVDSPDGLFLTEDYIVTHNTTLAVQMAANIIRPYERGLVMHYDFEQRFDISRAENITRLPIWEFEEGGRYILQQGEMSLEDAQEAIVKLYAAKIQNREELLVGTGKVDEFGKEIRILPPTVVIFDSVSNIIPDGFSVNNAKDMADAEKLRGNMAGARDAKTIRGFLRDISPLIKGGNIIIYAINHINSNVQISMFSGPQKQMNFLKPDESIPGGKALFYNSFNLPKLISKPSDDFTEATDGFNGHMVMIEPVKSSSNQSGNNSKGISFDLVFSYKNGFDSLRSLILYGKEKGLIEGTKPRLKFVGDPSFTFAWKDLNREKDEKPIWECVKKFIIPELETHLSFVEPIAFDERSMDY